MFSAHTQTQRALLRHFSSKFPANTVPGVFKAAIANNGRVDLARFHAQNYNWTVQEFDVSFYSHLLAIL